MDRIGRCKEHDTTFIAEENSIFNRCFVCVFEENESLRKEKESNLAWLKWMTNLKSGNIFIHRAWIAEALNNVEEKNNAT